MKLKEAIEVIYGDVNIIRNFWELVGTIHSAKDLGYKVINADADEQEKIASKIQGLYDAQVEDISLNKKGEICIYVK